MAGLMEFTSMPFNVDTRIGRYVGDLIKSTGEVVRGFADNGDRLEATKVHELMQKYMTPLSQARGLGLGATLASYVLYRYIPLFWPIFLVTTVASAFFTYDCHQTYSQIRNFDDWLIEHIDYDDGDANGEMISWDNALRKVRVTCDRLINSTWVVSFFLSDDLKTMPNCIKTYKENDKITFLAKSMILKIIKYLAQSRDVAESR